MANMSSLLNTSRTYRAFAWSCLFLANLAVPLLMGLGETQLDGRTGMYAGILACWAIGAIVCFTSATIGTALYWGAVFVAILQFIPFLQIYAGIYGVGIGSQFNSVPHHEYQRLDTWMSGLIATMITGGILQLAALAFGIVILGLSYSHNARHRRSEA